MVQNIGSGSINKIGSTENGRFIYQITDSNGQNVGKMSIPQKDCDVFEKSYHDIIETTPALQKFAQKHSTPESMQKLKKTSNWITGISTAIGAAIGIFTTSKLKTWQQVLATTVGTIGGYLVGSGAAFVAISPPGITKFNKATKNLSKIDIQPIQD